MTGLSRQGVYRFRVLVKAHEVPPRWVIPAHERVVFESDERTARLHGVRSAHRDAGVPALRSLTRVSWPFVSATREHPIRLRLGSWNVQHLSPAQAREIATGLIEAADMYPSTGEKVGSDAASAEGDAGSREPLSRKL